MVNYLRMGNTIRAKFHAIRDRKLLQKLDNVYRRYIRIITVYETFHDYKCGEREMQIDRM